MIHIATVFIQSLIWGRRTSSRRLRVWLFLRGMRSDGVWIGKYLWAIARSLYRMLQCKLAKLIKRWNHNNVSQLKWILVTGGRSLFVSVPVLLHTSENFATQSNATRNYGAAGAGGGGWVGLEVPSRIGNLAITNWLPKLGKQLFLCFPNCAAILSHCRKSMYYMRKQHRLSTLGIWYPEFW